MDLGDNPIWVGVALDSPTVPVAIAIGVAEAETCWVELTILVLTEVVVGAVFFVGVEPDKSILVGRGVLIGAFGVGESFGAGVFSAK